MYHEPSYGELQGKAPNFSEALHFAQNNLQVHIETSSISSSFQCTLVDVEEERPMRVLIRGSVDGAGLEGI